MTMTNNTIPNVPRELLADLLGNDHDKRIMAERHLLAMLANAPSPAGVDGLEVVAYLIGGEPSLTPCRVLGVVNEPLCHLPDAQAIIDGLRGEVAAQRVKTCIALKERNDAREERDAALVECERRQMQLAACGVVALANTIESAGEARQMHPDYMSASCSDVAGAVDRELALRTERDRTARRIAELETELEGEREYGDREELRANGYAADLVATTNKLSTSRERVREIEDLLREVSGWIDRSSKVYRHHATSVILYRIDAALSAGKKGE